MEEASRSKGLALAAKSRLMSWVVIFAAGTIFAM
jgi:hypothetical protein